MATADPYQEEAYSAGIDAGSVSLNCVVINEREEIVSELPYRRHLGKVGEGLAELIKELQARFSEGGLRSVSFTGSHGRKLADSLGAFYEFETICQVAGAVHLVPEARTIIAMGGQQTALFQIGQNAGGWKLEHFSTNGPCAAGTGSFIDQQAERLATSLYQRHKDSAGDDIDKVLADFIELGLTSENPAHVACRCTVFTKSDMIHLQNKGERLEDIIYGLHVGNARNYMSTIVGNRAVQPPVLFIGGLSLNPLQVKAFRSWFPDLVVPPSSTSMGALGVALLAREGGKEHGVNLERLRALQTAQTLPVPVAPRLVLTNTSFSDSQEIAAKPRGCKTRVYLGIDIGSTTTKYALINEEREILHKKYVPTQGRPIEVTQRLLREMRSEIGERIEIVGTATTGSGRMVVGDFLNVDLISDEITAHARGAVEIDPAVDTVFEIGGQDSKYIGIVNTHPLDFDMNKVCAAGTGSFLHELANKYGINIVDEFQDVALSSERPVRLAERCTVFMESDLTAYHQRGVAKKDLMAGLCYAIVHNYLNRVVGRRPIGERVMFLGGPSLNRAVVAAFEIVLGRGLIVPAHREVLGAYGAAISVQERMQSGRLSTTGFRGLGRVLDEPVRYVEKVCSADPSCHNQCKLKIYDFGGRKSVWGGECGRYETRKSGEGKKQDLFAVRREVWKRYLAGVCAELGEEPLLRVDGRPTVGIQRALYGHQTAILWAYFFHRLGLQPVLSPPTDVEISEAGIESTGSETCYPAKVSHGHVKALLGKTTYLFLPTLVTMPTAEPSEVGYYCPMLQSNSHMVRGAHGIDRSSILGPVVHLKYDPKTLAVEIAEQIGPKVGATRRAVREALFHALDRQEQFVAELHRRGRDLLAARSPDEPVVVVTGRPYNLYDERLNLRLGQNLAKVGLTALPMDFIDVTTIDLSDFPSMYWGLGAQIMRTAKFIRERPQCFGLHLTNFGCGPDSFIEHFYKHVMGDKPYLILELDEHTAVAGVMTRLAAYKNVIDNTMEKVRSTAFHGKAVNLEPRDSTKTGSFQSLNADVGRLSLRKKTLLLPQMSPVGSHLFTATFRAFGLEARVLDTYQGLDLGLQYTSGKECYPCQVTMGDILHHLKGEQERLGSAFDPEEYVYFIPETDGPCRFGMYNKYQRLVLDSFPGLDRVKIVSPSTKDAYSLGGMLDRRRVRDFRKALYLSVVVSDILERLLWRARPYEREPGMADAFIERSTGVMTSLFETHAGRMKFDRILDRLAEVVAEGKAIIDPEVPPKPLIGIVGEIYLRSHVQSNQDFIRVLERYGAEVVNASTAEWVNYVSYDGLRTAKREFRLALKQLRLDAMTASLRKMLDFGGDLLYKEFSQRRTYKKIRPLIDLADDHKVAHLEHALTEEDVYSFHVPTEACLSIAGLLDYARSGYNGVVNVYPFTCMPSMTTSAIARPLMSRQGVPYLDVPCDSSFQPGREAAIRTFMYQAHQHFKQNGRKAF